MSSQGWTPGSFLGARNAAHADMFTAASATHIKVAVKDDTLGLGARSRRGLLDEPTGLDAFKGLLGRLNGKSDTDLAQEQQKRDDVKLARYAATRWPTVRFISGGLLAQEKTETTTPKSERETRNNVGLKENALSANTPEKGNHYPASTGYLESNSEIQATCERDKAQNDEKAHAGLPDKTSTKSRRGREKESKKRKRSKRDNSHSDLKDQDISGDEPVKTSSKQWDLPLPSKSTATSKERRPMGRHTFRGRHIEAKKKALLDDKSLSEVLLDLQTKTCKDRKLISLDFHGQILVFACRRYERQLRDPWCFLRLGH